MLSAKLLGLGGLFLLAFLYLPTSRDQPTRFSSGPLPGSEGGADALQAALSAALRFRFSERVSDLRITSGATLKADPNVAENGAAVAVTWDHVSGPSLSEPYDWVGLYCPSDAEPRAYLDHAFVNESPSFADGWGTLKFVVYNLRTDCEFRYYRNANVTALIAVSNKITFAGGKSEPLQGHLALTGDPTQMRVSWTSGALTRPVVHYGLNKDNLTHSAGGISKKYTIFDMCGPPANDSDFFLDPGFLHDVLLTDLTPKKTYYYKYGSGDIFSSIKTFTTALAAGDTTPFRFLMYGDMGLSPPPGAQTTAQLALQEVLNGAAFLMNHGDLSYALGRAVMWDIWMSLIEPYASLAPYMISIGNHEYDHIEGGTRDPSGAKGEGFHPKWGNFGQDSAGECGVPQFYRFHMPDTGNSVFWYSYDYGLVHMVVISTEHDFRPGSRMYRWIEKDLRSVDRKLTPWVIFVGHRPMYTIEKYPVERSIMYELQKALEGLFYKYQVSLAVWGHCHAYERTCAVHKNTCDPKGTVHIVVGSAGYELDNAEKYDFSWSLHNEQNFGYLRVSVANVSALQLEFIHNIDKTVADRVWLHRN